jgi:hypothetical protein
VNPGWLEWFKNRNGIIFKNICRESREVSQKVISGWLESTLHALLKECSPTAFFYRNMPNKTLSFKGEQCSGGKKSKERVTVIVGCNADVSEKLSLFVIG